MHIVRKDIIKENRRGMVVIDRKMIYDEPEIMMKIFSKMVVTDIERHTMRDTLTYYAFSPLFDPVNETQACPEYDIHVFVSDSGDICIEVVKQQ